jgi:hypothetical protein
MENLTGWLKLLEGYPWFNCKDCYPIIAYSESMPPPRLGRKPYGKTDHRIFDEADPWGWKISELEENYELKPGIEHIGQQIMNNIIKLGKGLPRHQIGGHGGENLINNPYWPAELATRAGKLIHERFVVLLPLMLSRTQDDKGRIIWTFFGNSITDPETAFWKNFYSSPESENPESESLSFFSNLLREAYMEKSTDSDSLYKAGFRILADGSCCLPSWTTRFRIKDESSADDIKYLLTFRPFAKLPEKIKNSYLSEKLSIIPFPGSLVFWGMPGYLKLKKDLPVAGQLPLHIMIARNRGVDGMRVTQAGWFSQQKPDNEEAFVNESLIQDTYNRTHRWQRVHKYQDELNDVSHKIKIIKALFSTEPDALGLYDKPLASNSQLWDHNFDLLLDGPSAGKRKMTEVEKTILNGGLFGYRFYYPPMRTGRHDVFLNRPLVAFLPENSLKPVIQTDSLYGYLTCYHTDDKKMSQPVELWPRMQKRPLHLSAINDFNTEGDYYSHQTAFNIVSLLESWEMQNRKSLSRTYARSLLNVANHKKLEIWLAELDIHVKDPLSLGYMRQSLEGIIEDRYGENLPEPLTFDDTSTRQFEENWWNDIKFLAQGEFVYKDNADIMHDETTLSMVQKQHRDLERLGDYLIGRYKKIISDSGMSEKALIGELSFKWKTLFDFTQYGGWLGNQNGNMRERNILMIIPGKNRKQAVVFGDHYDTAYMEDVYDKERGGSGARLAAKGADDNYSASSTLLQAAPIFMKLSKEGKLERDIWLIHLTGEEFPSDCMGARNFCQGLIEKTLNLKVDKDTNIDISGTEITGVYVMDMIGHNRDDDRDIFQISPGKSAESLFLAYQAHISNMLWNNCSHRWNHEKRQNFPGGERIKENQEIPGIARYLALKGEVRTQYNPHSSLFNTDCQIFSDVGVPVVLFMENYDINRSGYHDTKDTLENIDLDYGAAFAAIAIETVARIATLKEIGF